MVRGVRAGANVTAAGLTCAVPSAHVCTLSTSKPSILQIFNTARCLSFGTVCKTKDELILLQRYEREKPGVSKNSTERSVCAWLLTPLSTLHHATQTTQLAPFTFSIRQLCQLSIYNSSNYLKAEGRGLSAKASL